MRRTITTALFLSLASQAEGQMFRGMFSTSAQGETRSFTFGATWFHGGHGEEVHVETKTACAGGLCEKQTVTMVHPQADNAPNSWQPSRLRAFMGRFAGGAPMPPPPPPPVVMDATGPMPGEVPPVGMGPPPSLRGILQRLTGGPPKYAHFVAVPVYAMPPMPPPQYTKSAGAGLTVPLAGAALAASVFFLATLLASAKYWQASSAREVSLRNLAEPLAPAEGAPRAAKAKKAKAPAPTPEQRAAGAAQTYLQGLYSKVQANVEKQAIGMYMGSVYERALA